MRLGRVQLMEQDKGRDWDTEKTQSGIFNLNPRERTYSHHCVKQTRAWSSEKSFDCISKYIH